MVFNAITHMIYIRHKSWLQSLSYTGKVKQVVGSLGIEQILALRRQQADKVLIHQASLLVEQVVNLVVVDHGQYAIQAFVRE